MTLEKLYRLFLAYPTICINTRKITKDCLFFALKGPHFNGNVFAKEALKKGAAHTIIDEGMYKAHSKCILVENVLETLQQLASFHRNKCNAKVVALTGSNGKTTTKELISTVLSKKYNTIATIGNLNNHIGVPLTLLSIKEDTEIAIVEMGANHKKEISFLCQIAQPDFGYITNFGKAHLKGFGGIEGVIEGKSELYGYLTSNDKYVFLNGDDKVQQEKLLRYIKKIGFSAQNRQYYPIKFIEADPFVVLEVEDHHVKTQLVGKYNFPNCCAAVLMGKYFNVPLNDIKAAIESYVPQNNRSQIISKNGCEIILDAYNANPSSMKAALENFKSMKAEHKTLILGDMFELGEDAAMEHQAIADLTTSLGFKSAILVGENFFQVETTCKKFNSFDELCHEIQKNPLKKGTYLIKGSRGMALERILEFL